LTDPRLCVRQWSVTREKQDHLAGCLAFLLLCSIGVAAARSGWSGVAVLSGVIVLGVGALVRWVPGIVVRGPAQSIGARRSRR
jgi:protein-S-isoprenylcysteine O-methyltransferase Ste14